MGSGIPRSSPPPGPPALPSAWARVDLLAGRSEGTRWEVSSAVANARVDVGASARCAWCVLGNGIAQRQFEFYWDGQVLWVGNLYGTTNVRIDGEPLSGWRALTGVSRIEFGQAAMRVETSAAAALDDRALPPEEPVGEEGKTRIFQELDADAHTSQRVPPHEAPRAFGSQDAHGDSSELAMQPTRMLSASTELPVQETRLVTSPLELGDSAPRPVPGAGAGAVRLGEADHGSLSSDRAEPSLPPLAVEMSRIGVPRPSRPSLTSQTSTDGLFAPPPVESSKTAKTSAAAARAGHRSNAALPPRTIALLVVVLLAAVWVLFLDDGPTRPVALGPGARPGRPGAAADHGPAPGLGDAATSPDAGPSEARFGLAIVDAGIEAVDVDAGTTEASTRHATPSRLRDAGPTPARLAADLLMTGRLSEALDAYLALTQTKPTNPAYGAIVEILETQLRARCRDGRDTATGKPCVAR